METPSRPSVFRRRSFIVTSIAVPVLMAAAYEFGSLSVQVSVVGTLVGIVAGFLLSFLQEIEKTTSGLQISLSRLGALLPVSASPRLRLAFGHIVESLSFVATSPNHLFHDLACERVSDLGRDFRGLSRMQLDYVGTEAWRNAYADLLRRADLETYHSVAWLRMPDYWQDRPGEQSLQLNLDLVEQGVEIHRIVILRPSTCQENGQLVRPLYEWLQRQHDGGIRLQVVQEQALQREADLLADFGLYGEDAVGVLEVNPQSTTLRFKLSFNPDDLDTYRDRWERLRLYAQDWHPGQSGQS